MKKQNKNKQRRVKREDLAELVEKFKADRDRIAAMVADFGGVTKLAQKLNLACGTVHDLLKWAGIPRWKKPEPPPLPAPAPATPVAAPVQQLLLQQAVPAPPDRSTAAKLDVLILLMARLCFAWRLPIDEAIPFIPGHLIPIEEEGKK